MNCSGWLQDLRSQRAAARWQGRRGTARSEGTRNRHVDQGRTTRHRGTASRGINNRRSHRNQAEGAARAQQASHRRPDRCGNGSTNSMQCDVVGAASRVVFIDLLAQATWPSYRRHRIASRWCDWCTLKVVKTHLVPRGQLRPAARVTLAGPANSMASKPGGGMVRHMHNTCSGQ